MKRLVFALLILFCGNDMSAQTYTKEVCVRFPVASSVLNPNFGDNAASLAEIVKFLTDVQKDSTLKLTSVKFCGSASPEGGPLLNQRLTERRCANMERYVRERVQLPDAIVSKCECSEMWQKLAYFVEKSDMPYRDEVLHQIRETEEFTYNSKGVLVDSRKKRLMDLNYGRTWNYMLREFFPAVRNASLISVYIEQKPTVVDNQKAEVIVPEEPVTQEPQVEEPALEPERRNAYLAIKTNMLYDALGVPNIGMAFSLGKRWSIAADWMYAWWNNNHHHNYWRIYGGGISLRKWFGKASKVKPLQGHHLGINAQAFTYDFELGGKGYMAGIPGGTLWDRTSYAVGAEYGYSLPIAKRLNIDFSVVAGYMGGRYYEYEPLDGHYVWKATKNRHWIGPTKAEVSLVWLLGHGNYNNKKKGGDK